MPCGEALHIRVPNGLNCFTTDTHSIDMWKVQTNNSTGKHTGVRGCLTQSLADTYARHRGIGPTNLSCGSNTKGIANTDVGTAHKTHNTKIVCMCVHKLIQFTADTYHCSQNILSNDR